MPPGAVAEPTAANTCTERMSPTASCNKHGEFSCCEIRASGPATGYMSGWHHSSLRARRVDADERTRFASLTPTRTITSSLLLPDAPAPSPRPASARSHSPVGNWSLRADDTEAKHRCCIAQHASPARSVTVAMCTDDDHTDLRRPLGLQQGQSLTEVLPRRTEQAVLVDTHRQWGWTVGHHPCRQEAPPPPGCWAARKPLPPRALSHR